MNPYESRDGGRDLPSSGEVAPTMGKVPCEFWAEWPTFIFQPVAPDMIWHIYSHLYCSLRDGGRALLSSGEAAPTMGKVSCEFRADQPTFIFQPVAPDVIWHIYSHLYCSLRDGGRDLSFQGRQPLPWGRSLVSFRLISLGLVFQGKSWDKGPSSLALPKIVHHPWPAAPDMIWHIYLHLYCSSRDGGRDLPSSGEAAPTMRQVPCEFWADQPTFIFEPAAPDMIWHIYLHLYCSLRDGGRDLLSSGRGSPYHGEGPLWILSRLAKLHFSVGSSWHDLAHLLWALLLNGGWCHPLAVFRGGAPWSGEGPLQFHWWVQYPLKMAGPYLQPCPQ